MRGGVYSPGEKKKVRDVPGAVGRIWKDIYVVIY